MTKRTLIPRNIINIEGKLAYGEGFQSWILIKIKKEIINEFPQLKEKRSLFSYKLIFHRTYEELFKAIKKLKNDDVMPMLLWLCKEE